MAGWQDAVANLQSQINTINSQISSLSGQEAANASAISSLQTQVVALQTELLSVQQQFVLGEIFPSSLAVLSPVTVASQTIQLIAGGDAVIQIPFQTEPFRIRVGGSAHIANNPGQNFSVSVLLNNLGIASIDPDGNNTTSPFFFDFLLFWEAGTQRLISVGSAYKADTPSGLNSEPQSGSQHLPLSSSMQIKIVASSQGLDAGSVTINQFKIIPN
jgi:hypothetical protein